MLTEIYVIKWLRITQRDDVTQTTSYCDGDSCFQQELTFCSDRRRQFCRTHLALHWSTACSWDWDSTKCCMHYRGQSKIVIGYQIQDFRNTTTCLSTHNYWRYGEVHLLQLRRLNHVSSAIYGKGPHSLLRANSRAACKRVTVNHISNHLILFCNLYSI